jgi:hypothetical protein
MPKIVDLFKAAKVTVAGPGKKALAVRIAKLAGLEAYHRSLTLAPGGAVLLARKGIEKSLLVVSLEANAPAWAWEFAGMKTSASLDRQRLAITVCQLTHDNATALRRNFPHTAPRVFGTKTAAGLGDRLGVGTPGHVRAIRGTGLVPFFAQQSIREMTRTGREAHQVMDDATWGVFEEGWDEGFGSDADHLKSTSDIDTCIAAGFTMYTIDPGEHVDNSADTISTSELSAKMGAVDWRALETTEKELRKSYLTHPVTLPGRVTIDATEETLARAAVKYGAAVSHTAAMFRHLAGRMGEKPFELEMSVDETATPTSTFEHYFVARELRRLGVKWVSLAPRFVGEFEKGIDYKGSIPAFRKSFAEHVAVMKELGPYKISIHSGSDKFSVYPVMAKLTGGLVHLKTAGTSYLEALRVLAKVEPDLFREILDFAFARYEEDKKSYHVSARLDKVPRSKDLKDSGLPKILDSTDGRQLLHVTFGSVLTTKVDGRHLFRERLLTAMRENEEAYYAALKKHLGRHVKPFAVKVRKGK